MKLYTYWRATTAFRVRIALNMKGKGHTQEQVVQWMLGWMKRGLEAYQSLVPYKLFSFGTQPTMADIRLIPQLYNAHRWGLEMRPFKRLTDIENLCPAMPAFADAN